MRNEYPHGQNSISTGSSARSNSPLHKMLHYPSFPLNSKSTSPVGDFKNSTEILSESFNYLTIYEQDEIILYDKIYYFGQNCSKPIGSSTTSEGEYIAISGDHLAYRYEIIRLIGKGVFGQVFECIDRKRNENVAVKVLKSQNRFRRSGVSEAKILADLQDTCDCIVKMYRSFEFRGHFCIVFELLELNLHQLLEKHEHHGLAMGLVKRIAIQLLIALKTVHSLGIIHSDLKPDNVLLKYENKSLVKIIDFGSACAEPSLEYVQSRFYRAPEVVLGKNYDEKIDIWSLGCILFECYTGYPLFPAESEMDLFVKINEVVGKPQRSLLENAKFKQKYEGVLEGIDGNSKKNSLKIILEGADRRFVDFIEQCLEWDPRSRISAESGLLHSWIKGRD